MHLPAVGLARMMAPIKAMFSFSAFGERHRLVMACGLINAVLNLARLISSMALATSVVTHWHQALEATCDHSANHTHHPGWRQLRQSQTSFVLDFFGQTPDIVGACRLGFRRSPWQNQHTHGFTGAVRQDDVL